MSCIDVKNPYFLNIPNMLEYLKVTNDFNDNGEIEIKHKNIFDIYIDNEMLTTMKWELYKYNNNTEIQVSSEYTFLLYPPNVTNLIGGDLKIGFCDEFLMSAELLNNWKLVIINPNQPYRISSITHGYSLVFKNIMRDDNGIKLIEKQLNVAIDNVTTTTLVTSSISNIITNIISRSLMSSGTLYGLISTSIISSVGGTIMGFAFGQILSSYLFPNTMSIRDVINNLKESYSKKEK